VENLVTEIWDTHLFDSNPIAVDVRLIGCHQL
jgi:hypothetical protein